MREGQALPFGSASQERPLPHPPPLSVCVRPAGGMQRVRGGFGGGCGGAISAREEMERVWSGQKQQPDPRPEAGETVQRALQGLIRRWSLNFSSLTSLLCDFWQVTGPLWPQSLTRRMGV